MGVFNGCDVSVIGGCGDCVSPGHSPRVDQEPAHVQLEQQADDEDGSFVAQAEDELSDDDLPIRKQVCVCVCWLLV